MKDADTYKRCAAECQRIARTMAQDHRGTLMAIADAWLELAREAERQGGAPGKVEGTEFDRRALRRAPEE